MSIVNRYDDEFAATLAPLVNGLPLAIAPRRVILPEQHDWSVSIDGVVPFPPQPGQGGPSETITIEFDVSLSSEPDSTGQASTYAFGFHYALSPRVEITKPPALDSLPTGQLRLLPTYGDKLRPRHLNAFGFVLFRLSANVSALTLELTVTKAPEVPGPFVSAVKKDVALSSFVVYTLRDYKTRVWIGSVDITDAEAVEKAPDLKKLDNRTPGCTPGAGPLRARLEARGDARLYVEFNGNETVGNSGMLRFEFPVEPQTSECTWSILPYLANLAHYGYKDRDRLRILSYAERLTLDANSPHLPRLEPGDGPRTGADTSPYFRWAHRVLHLQRDTRDDLGGAGRVTLAPMLRFCQDQGVSLLIADTSSPSASQAAETSAAYAEARRYDLLRIVTPFAWQDLLKISGEGPGASTESLVAVAPPEISRSANLCLNPEQTDHDVLAAAARQFARGQQSWAIEQRTGRGEWLVELPEIGDAWAPMPFVLPVGGPEAALRQKFLDELAEMNFRLPLAWTPLQSNLLTARDEQGIGLRIERLAKLRVRADSRYHQGYWQHLMGEFDQRVGYWSRGEKFPEPASILPELRPLARDILQNLQDLSAVFCTGSVGTNLNDGDKVFKDVKADYSRFDDVVPSNGPHDLCEYGTPQTAPRPISVRRALAQATTTDRVQWYCQFRHWVNANLALLVAASSALKQAVSGAPHLTYTNLSKPIGYWGFESYHTVRSGACDIVWMHDDYTRGTQIWNHLIFGGVRADFARALTRLPYGTVRPFAPATRPLGAYLSNDRVDIKALQWASRGARHFEAFFSGDAYSEQKVGWGNSGDMAYQPLAQGRSAMNVLRATSSFFKSSERVSTRVAMLVPQTESIWTLPDHPEKGFLFPDLLSIEFHGVHAMFTHEQLPVDLVFEEAVVDGIVIGVSPLSSYAVLYVDTPYLRDDVFHAVARWVSAGGILILGAGRQTQGNLGTALRNEFDQDRSQTRRAWLEHGPALAVPEVRRAGTGCVIDLQARRPGSGYIEALDLQAGFMAPPAHFGAAQAHRGAFFQILDLALSSIGLAPLQDWRSAWVTFGGLPIDPNRLVLVEVVDLRYVSTGIPTPPGRARRGAVVIINHAHRQYRQSAWAGPGGPHLDATTAEPERERTPVVLHLKSMAKLTEVIVAPGPVSPLTLQRDADGVLRIPIKLGDYAVVGWTRGAGA